MKSIIIISVFLIAILACAKTNSAEAPGFIETNTTFQADVTAEVTIEDWPNPEYGYLSVLVPGGWNVDNMTFTGPNSGEMTFAFWGIPVGKMRSGYCDELDEWDKWMSFISDSEYVPVEGDIYSISMDIHTNDTLGIFDIAFLAWGSGAMGYAAWDGDPCTITVEVVEASLEQTTWGSLKSHF